MNTLQIIYDHSPISLQNVMCTISGYLKNNKRYGNEYIVQRRFLEEFDKLPLNSQIEFQTQELQKFIKFAVTYSEFYRNLYKDIDIGSIKTVDDLKKLPIVDKEMLRSNIKTVMTIGKLGSVIWHTGGTTGKSLTVRATKTDSCKRMAFIDHFKSRVGFENLKMKKATFSGNHIIPPFQKSKIFWRYNASCKQMLYSSFHLTEENMPYYIESLNIFKPMALDGFFTSLCDIANFIERKKIQIKFQPIAIFPTSETLTKSGRQLLERVFLCKVYNQYSSSEGAPFVTECQDQILHMELSSGIIEHIDDDNTEILVTSFITHGTPLIRYRIGDCMVFSSKLKSEYVCKCGLHSHIVEEIQGRSLDFLYTSSGAKINGGNVANLLKNIPNNAIIQSQFIQKKIGEIELLLKVDTNIYNIKYEELLRSEFVHKFGLDTIISIKLVDEIPREQNGKFRMIKNTVYI